MEKKPFDIVEEWHAYLSWLKARIPPLALRLQDPAAAGKLDELEAVLGVVLPDGYRKLYSINNGELFPPWEGVVLGLIFEPLERTIAKIQGWQSARNDAKAHDLFRERERGESDAFNLSSTPAGHIRLTPLNPLWVPFLGDGGGNYIGVDLDPGLHGMRGQVINFGRDYEPQRVLATDLASFFNGVNRLVTSRALDDHIDVRGEEGYFFDVPIFKLLGLK